MLFSYTLIFFLFTTFVAAAPVNRPILADKEFFTGNGGEWYPVSKFSSHFSYLCLTSLTDPASGNHIGICIHIRIYLTLCGRYFQKEHIFDGWIILKDSSFN
jgi:hypothetical protein